jgi:hypothetical protein
MDAWGRDEELAEEIVRVRFRSGRPAGGYRGEQVARGGCSRRSSLVLVGVSGLPQIDRGPDRSFPKHLRITSSVLPELSFFREMRASTTPARGNRDRRRDPLRSSVADHGYQALLAWLRSHGNVASIGVESIGSSSATLSRSQPEPASRPSRQTDPTGWPTEGRESDRLDAEQTARAVLGQTSTATPDQVGNRRGVSGTSNTLRVFQPDVRGRPPVHGGARSAQIWVRSVPLPPMLEMGRRAADWQVRTLPMQLPGGRCRSNHAPIHLHRPWGTPW